MEEQWKSIPGYEKYSVSTLGRVRRDAPCYGFIPNRVLSPSKSPNGYIRYGLYDSTGRVRKVLAHRCVLMAFVGTPPPRYDAHHKDGVKDNNSLDNLEWVSRKDNIFHSRRYLGKCIGQMHGRHKLTLEQVLEIRARTTNETNLDVAKRYGVDPSTIGNILNGRTWAGALDFYAPAATV